VAERGLPSRSPNASDEINFDREVKRALNSVAVPAWLSSKLAAHIRQQALSDLEPARPELEAAWLEPMSPPHSRLGSLENSSLSPSGAQHDLSIDHRLAEAARTVASPQVPGYAQKTSNTKESVGKKIDWKKLATCICLGSAGVVLIALFYFNQPLSKDRLVETCLAEVEKLEKLASGQGNWQAENLPAELRKSLERFRPVRTARNMGMRQLSASRFGSGRVWQLVADGRAFYVFEFREYPTITDVHSQLAVIRQRSGGWSFASCIDQTALLVVAYEGTIELDIPSYAMRATRVRKLLLST
jgi:hypothetical protein